MNPYRAPEVAPPEPTPRRWRGWLAGAVVLLGLVGTAALALPGFLNMNSRAMKTEVLTNVDSLRTAELAHEAAFDIFVQMAGPLPRPIGELDRRMTAWTPTPESERLGWSPDGPVRGTYWVELSPQGDDFTVHGLCDIDQDGEPAHYVATRHQPARAISDEDVY